MNVSLDITPELVEAIAQRVAELQDATEPATATGHGRWLRGAAAIAKYLDAKVSRINALSSAGRIPVEHDGSWLIAHTVDLDRWVREGGGKRP